MDDEDTIVDMTATCLSEYGYQVDTFTNGVEALRQFKEDSDRYDLFIADMTGTELAQTLLGIRPALPVILCTSGTVR